MTGPVKPPFRRAFDASQSPLAARNALGISGAGAGPPGPTGPGEPPPEGPPPPGGPNGGEPTPSGPGRYQHIPVTVEE